MIFWKQNSCDVVLQIKNRYLFKLGENGSKRIQISLMITSIYNNRKKTTLEHSVHSFIFNAPIKFLKIWQDK